MRIAISAIVDGRIMATAQANFFKRMKTFSLRSSASLSRMPHPYNKHRACIARDSQGRLHNACVRHSIGTR